MVYMLLGTGFEETEAVTPLDLLRRAGIEICTVGLNGKQITGSHGIRLEADLLPDEVDLTTLEMVILPGGLKGVSSIQASKEAKDIIQYAWTNQKYVSAICAAPTVLASLGITDYRNATCFPGQEKNMGSAVIHPEAASVTDGNIITAASCGTAIPFAHALITALKGQDEADAILKQIVIR